MTTLVLYFDEFLTHNFNSAKDFALSLPKKENLIIKKVPVTYFKHDYINPIKKYKPKTIFMFGMDDMRANPHLETRAKNKMIILKNPFLNFLANSYVFLLKLFKKNLKTKTLPKKDMLKLVPINKEDKEFIKLKSKLDLKTIKKSTEPHYFTCNFAMWSIQKYIDKNNLNINFYFIHTPLKGLTKNQQKELKVKVLNS